MVMAPPSRSGQQLAQRQPTWISTKCRQLGWRSWATTKTGSVPTRTTRRTCYPKQDLQMVNDTNGRFGLKLLGGAPPSPKSPVVNISKHTLSDNEIKVLDKGLSYVPTNNPDNFTIRAERYQFFRKVRLKYFFRNSEPKVQSSVTGLRPPSTFVPYNSAMSHKILAFEEVVWRDVQLLLGTKTYVRYNTSKDEKAALQSLANNDQVVIKPADKGGAIVVQDMSSYKSEILHQLNDGVSYQLLRADPSKAIALEILEITKAGLELGFLSELEFNFLNQKHPRLDTIYTIPKIHKSLTNPPGRPIVSGCGSILEPLGKYIDFFLKPLAESTPTFLRDTMHTINIVEKSPFDPELQRLATCDVMSLYTSIPQQEALNVITRCLQQRPAPVQVPTEFIVSLLRIAMTKNFFIFKNKFYIQTSGVAMGAPFAPDVAILYMAAFEEDTILNPVNPFRDQLGLWMRYIDDILMIWNGDRDDLMSFFTWLNHQSDFLKFTIESDNHRIHFLDLTIYEDAGALLTKLYRKPAERNSLLLYDSHHPRALRDNLPFGQFLRIRRNCSDREHYLMESDELTNRLLARGYPRRLIKQSRKRAWFYPREELLFPNNNRNQQEERMVCVTAFNTKSNQIKRIINHHWQLISDDINQPSIPLHAFKKAKSVKDFVVRSLLSTPQDPTITTLWNLPPVTGHSKCGNCKACETTIQGKEFHHDQLKIQLKAQTNCNSANVIYAILCPCQQIYIGQTQQKIKARILQHMSRIRCGVQGAPLVEHFSASLHPPDSLRWVVIEKATLGPRGGNISSILNTRELEWMFFFNSIDKGLNEHDSSFSQLATLT
ncbi:uncharacterized protein LOC144823662 [Lissotriton helveticus]